MAKVENERFLTNGSRYRVDICARHVAGIIGDDRLNGKSFQVKNVLNDHKYDGDIVPIINGHTIVNDDLLKP